MTWQKFSYPNVYLIKFIITPKICIPRVGGHSTPLQNSSPSFSQNILVITLAYLSGKYALLEISFRCSLCCATSLKIVRWHGFARKWSLGWIQDLVKGGSDKCPREADHPRSYEAMLLRKILNFRSSERSFPAFSKEMEASFLPLKQTLF